jgi:hypothetical protein
MPIAGQLRAEVMRRIGRHQELQGNDDSQRRGRILKRDMPHLRHHVQRRQSRQWRRERLRNHHQGAQDAAIDEYQLSHRLIQPQ